jgi:peptidoglycan/xylan/chitin deacetylase (PgdA/CDA1 family)
VTRRAALGLALLSAGLAIPPTTSGQQARPIQWVLLGLDTTPERRRPVETSAFHHLYEAINRHLAPGAPPRRFTLFIATGGLTLDPHHARRVLAADRAHLGTEPRNRPVIRYSPDVGAIRDRAANIRDLGRLGIEIASHAVRHDHGRAWSEERWRREHAEHRRISRRLELPLPRGFRAPFLEWNDAMYRVMEAEGMRFDASRTGGQRWPRRHPGTDIWSFRIPSVPVSGRAALFFDDNLQRILLREAEAGGIPEADRQGWLDRRFLGIAEAAFRRHYEGNRAPFLISGHGRFRAGMIRLMRIICAEPEVRCGTFSEAVAYLDAHPELEGR